MSTITVDELEADPLGSLRHVENGETLIVISADGPLAEIKPLSAVVGKVRPYALCAGHFVVNEAFNEPLPEAVLADFEE